MLTIAFALVILPQAIKTTNEAVVLIVIPAIWMLADGYKKEKLSTTLIVILGMTIILLTPFFGGPVYYTLLGVLILLFGFSKPNINLLWQKRSNYKEA